MPDLESPFRNRREELNLSQSDIAFELRQLGEKTGRKVAGTIGAVSAWDRGQPPDAGDADLLAVVYRATEEQVWKWIRQMTEARREATAAK